MNSKERAVADALKPVGLHRQRARAIKLAAKCLVSSFDGQIPNRYSKLIEIPGIGDYSAKAIQSFAFGQPVAIVDSNVERIIRRVFFNRLSQSADKGRVATIAADLLPHSGHQEFNYALLDIGRTICRYKDPSCLDCPIWAYCDFGRHGSNEDSRLPMSKPSSAAVEIKALRQERGLSLKSLALRSGVSKLTIINLEAGRTHPRASTIRKIASAIGVDPKRWGHE